MHTSAQDIGTAPYLDDVSNVLAQLERRTLPAQPIAFYGSSSFRLWQSMAMDLQSLDVVNLGFGGGTYASGLHHLDTLLIPLQATKVVLYFGENDISIDGLSAESTALGLRTLCEHIEARTGGVPVYVLSAKQSPTKWIYADVVAEFNALAEHYCSTQSHLHYVDVTRVLLGEHGRPMSRYFQDDLVHLNAHGYAQWARLLRSQQGLFVPGVHR